MNKDTTVLVNFLSIIEKKQALYASFKADASLKDEDFVEDLNTEIHALWAIVNEYTSATEASIIEVKRAKMASIIHFKAKQEYLDGLCGCGECNS